MAHTRFEAIGAYLPSKVVSTKELVAQMSYSAPFDLEQITGIKHRRVYDESHDPPEDSFHIALRAARDCLGRSRYRADEIDVVISTSISRSRDGHQGTFEPSFALLLKQALGARAAIHFDISNACAGMLTGVYILDRMIKAGVVKNGMVVSGERITPIAETAVKEICEPLDPQFGSLTVGDAGAAVIIDASESPDDRIHYIEMMTCAEYSKLCIGMPSDKNDQFALYTINKEMHSNDRIQLWPRFQIDVLARLGTTFEAEQFDYIVHHQVGQMAVRNFSKLGGKMFGAPMPESLTVLEEYGNTATTSHFVVLHEHLRQKRLKKGAKILLVPAASGVITGCVSVTISSLEV